MAKKIVAVTAIKHGEVFVNAGEPLDPSAFSKAELKDLHDNGAIMVVDDSKAEEVKGEDLTPEQLGQRGAQMQDVSAEAKESTAAQINAAKEAPESTEDKTAATPAKAAPPKK